MRRRWPPFVAREAVLADLEQAITATPQALDARFYYASFLRDHGRLDDALAAFADVLAAVPDHVATLVAYGVALARAGRRLDARVPLERAVAIDATHLAAAVSLANVLVLDDPARAHALYDAALAHDPANAAAHRGLCSLAAARGDAAAATRHRRLGYASGPFAVRPYFGEEPPVAVLALVSTDGGNIPLDSLLDARRYLVHECYVEAYDGESIPAHAFIVNAVADADRGATALRNAERVSRQSHAPVINAPRAVAETSRLANAARLAHIPHVVVPDVWRAAAHQPAAFPVIVRAPGAHMGRGMERVDNARAYRAARARVAGRPDVLAIRYVETQSPDGAWRKYRVMSVAGRRYPLHLAIGHRWDVHYFSAAMSERAEYRAEEAAFLSDPAGVLGAPAWTALERVFAVLGLDYAGIDFGRLPDGRLVLFEANAAMTVLAPDPADDASRYRFPAFARIRAAIDELFAAASPSVAFADQEANS
jgi:tetratricopeptide (TPR) repeat protein